MKRKIMTKEIIRKLDHQIMKFYEFCHIKDCKDILVCPERHVKCKEKLDIETAIAWRVATHTSKLIDILTLHENLGSLNVTSYSSVEELKETMSQIELRICTFESTMKFLVSFLLFHENKYLFLNKEIWKLITIAEVIKLRFFNISLNLKRKLIAKRNREFNQKAKTFASDELKSFENFS